MNKADIILHPVRWRILIALSGGQHLTMQQIARMLPEESQATLYRQMHMLEEGGLVRVVTTRPTRGTVQKVYGLVEDAALLQDADIAAASRADHVRYLALFVTEILGAFERYAAQPDFDIHAFTYQAEVLELDDAAYLALMEDLRACIRAAQAQPLRTGGRRRAVWTIAMPTTDASSNSAEEES